jgi:hypothetical protein
VDITVARAHLRLLFAYREKRPNSNRTNPDSHTNQVALTRNKMETGGLTRTDTVSISGSSYRDKTSTPPRTTITRSLKDNTNQGHSSRSRIEGPVLLILNTLAEYGTNVRTLRNARGVPIVHDRTGPEDSSGPWGQPASIQRSQTLNNL